VTAPAEVRHFLNTSTNMLSESIIVITIIVTMFFISATAVIILLTGGILFILVVRYIGNKVAFRLGRLQMHSMRAENEVISGYLSGLRQIRSVCGDEHWRKKYDIALDEYWDRFIGLSFFRIIPSAILQFLFLVSIAVLVISLYYLYQERFLFIIPIMGAFVFSALKVIPRLAGMSNEYMDMMDQWPNLDAIHNFLNDTRYHTIRNGTRVFAALSADIVFENVAFSYYPNQRLLEGIGLAIGHNKVTALVGHSGSASQRSSRCSCDITM
jgi:ABC-type multidrug transport system fused ATPase/permease subunit